MFSQVSYSLLPPAADHRGEGGAGPSVRASPKPFQPQKCEERVCQGAGGLTQRSLRVIEANYSRIRDVEKELRELQFELKITAGPKKSVLELLRKKIEAQNTKVIAGRERVKKAKEVTSPPSLSSPGTAVAVFSFPYCFPSTPISTYILTFPSLLPPSHCHCQTFCHSCDGVEYSAPHLPLYQILEAAEADLKKEEDVKDQLCQELNLVVQQSAHAQLDKLEQLTSRLEALSGGAAASCNPQRSGGDKPAAREVSTSSSNPFLDPPDLSHEDPSAGKLQADAKVAAAAASRAAREAEEARARHVSLPSSRPARARQREEDSLQRKNDKQGHCQQAKERQQKPKAPEGGGKFSGFDA